MATHDTDALGTDTDSDASEDVGAGETRMIEAKADMTVVKRGQGEREKQCMTSNVVQYRVPKLPASLGSE